MGPVYPPQLLGREIRRAAVIRADAETVIREVLGRIPPVSRFSITAADANPYREILARSAPRAV